MKTPDNGHGSRGWLEGVTRIEVAWFAGLILLLCTDLAVRNIDTEWPLAAVFAAWAVAFALPALALYVPRFLRAGRRPVRPARPVPQDRTCSRHC